MSGEPRTWSTVDKSTWGDGPWQGEPDKVVWVDAATDLDCMVHRGPLGSLCGYVGVPAGHQLYGVSYDAVDVEVHGGLTYASTCDEQASEEHGLCHVPQPGRTGDVWWLGFDCGHAWDVQPGLDARMRTLPYADALREHADIEPAWMRGTYKPLSYVVSEVTALAAQLARANPQGCVDTRD